MKVTACQFQVSAARAADFPRDGRPEIAFMGRSNVGKSSLINRLLGSRGLARVSKTPGRTRAINFFLVNDRVYFVDLPGYGYARVPLPVREQWKGLVESYLEAPGRPDLSIHLVDARHEPTDMDLELLEYLRAREIPYRVVLTKADKIPGHERVRTVREAAGRLALQQERPPIAVSAETGDGIPALWRVIGEACETRRPSVRVVPPSGGTARSDGELMVRGLDPGRMLQSR
jgi:GTP-binding protein